MADPKHPRHHGEAFKRQIAQSCESGKPSREIRAGHDIAQSTPRRRVQGIRDSGSTRAADNRTPGRNEPVEPGRRNRRLEMEVDVRVFHTDRGGEFDNTRIDEPPDVFGIKRSLSRKGNPYDNAVVESTNRLLKKELVYRNSYATIEQLRHDLNDYVWWSDNQRLHSTLGYRSPKEFTEQGLVL